MSDEVLINRAAELYSPFDAAEAKRLREYVEAVDDFLELPFLKHACKWKIEKVDAATSRYEETLDYVGESALFDMAGRFRLLYLPKHRMSFDSVRGLLYKHVVARTSALQADALAELQILRAMKKRALKSPWTMTVNGEQWGPARIIDLHLNGRYLHRDDNDTDLLDTASVIVRSEFLVAIKSLAYVFAVGRAVVQPILNQPSLLAVQMVTTRDKVTDLAPSSTTIVRV